MAKPRRVADIKCPKCGSRTFTLKDFSIMANHRYVENGVWDGETQMEPEGMLSLVQAQCHNDDCKHEWRVKSVTRVDQLEEITE